MPAGGQVWPFRGVSRCSSVCPSNPRLHVNWIEDSRVWRKSALLTCAGCEFGAKWAQSFQIWSVGTDSHDLMRLKTRRKGARVYCNWSLKRHQFIINIHRSSLPLSLPHAFAHVLCSGAYARLYNSYDPPPAREHPMLRG